MVALVARKGRHRQRYEEGCRLVAGCVPFRYTGESEEILEVLMVTPHKGDGLLFPKGGWEDDESMEEAACREALEEAGVQGEIMENLGDWYFRSRGHHDVHSSEGSRKGYMFALFVTKILDSWPEKDVRQRRWVTVTEAMGFLKHGWMKEALKKFDRFSRELRSPLSVSVSVDDSESSLSASQSSDEDFSEQSACDDDDIPSSVIEESASSSSE